MNKAGSVQHARPVFGLFLLLFLSDSILHALAGFEGRRLSRFDLDRFAGAGIPSAAGGTLPGLKGSEAGQDHFPVGHKAADNGVQRGGDDLLGFRFGDFRFGGYDFNQICFYQR